MKYSLIVPYYRTPEITRLALHSMFHFAAGEPEVIVVDNAPGGEESRMLDEFPKICRINNSTSLRGSDANFEALDIGLTAARHDHVGLVHSDSIFMQPGWDVTWFGHLDRQNLSALGTFEREANPFRPFRKRLEDQFKHLVHRRRVKSGLPGKLAMHFLLTRRTDLETAGFNFKRDRDLLSRHFDQVRNGVEVLSLREISSLMWHTSNITSLLTGQMTEPRLIRSYKLKRRRFLADPFVQKHFAAVLPREPSAPAPAVEQG